ncbi:MAG: electron transfer flavoprotein subunit alpha/FixB family protein [Terriglobales bacterium]
MIPRILAYVRHYNGVLDDTAAELADVAKKIDPSSPLTALVTGVGPELETVCERLRALYQEVWKVANPALEHVDPEFATQVMRRVLPKDAVVVLAHDYFSIDVGPGLSVALNAAYVADVVGIEHLERTTLHVICQEFSGQFSTRVACDISGGAVITVRPGAFKVSDSVAFSGTVIDKSLEVPLLHSRRKYIETIRAAAGDVDITKYDVLVSVGRGIQKQENISIAKELADVLGAALSCSRPVVDAKWLDKSRQVGSSGKTVKPKVYLACGISGQFQHLAGLKGNPFIIAINKNPKAPIFQIADVGVVADILEFLPELTNKVSEEHTATAGARH